MDLEDVHWSQLTKSGMDRVQRTFATHRDKAPSTRKVPHRVPESSNDFLRGYQAGLAQRFSREASARGIMWFCIASCAGIFFAWNWSLSTIPYDNKSTRKPRSPEQISVYNKLVNNFMITRQDMREGRYWTLITPAFSHIQSYHLFGNLIAFHTFSTTAISGGLTALPYAALIFGSAVSSHVAFLYQDAQRQRKRDIPVDSRVEFLQHQRERNAPVETRALGLSGVVMGLGAMVSIAMPKARVLFWGIVPIPVWGLMIGYTFYDSARLNDETSTTGHAAHLGGAAFGALFYFLKLRRGR